jgi:hypothetical protein
MNLFRFPRPSTLMLIACSAVMLGANALSAQVSRGEFTLPVETHWGSVVMAPGSYSYTLDKATVGLMISVRGQGMSVSIPATGAVSTGQPLKGSSTLFLITEGGETSVRSMQFGHLGLTVHYQPSNRKESHKTS